MSKLTKNTIFWMALSIFIVASPVVVLYAMGYVFDSDNLTLVRTGSLRFVTNTPSNIKINSVEVGRTSFFNTSFQNSFGLSRVKPGHIKVEIKSDSGNIWQKNIILQSAEFMDFPKIVIPPLSVEQEFVASLSFSANKSILSEGFLYIFNDSKDKKNPRQSDKVARFDMRNVFLRSLISSQSLEFSIASISQLSKSQQAVEFSGTFSGLKPSSPINSTTFGADARTAFYSGKTLYIVWPKQTGYQPFISPSTVSEPIKFEKNIDNIFWYKDGEHLLVLSGGVLYFVDIDFRGEIQKNIILENINGPVIYIDYQNSVFVVDNNKKAVYRVLIDF